MGIAGGELGGQGDFFSGIYWGMFKHGSSLRGRDCAHREGRDSYLPERPVGRGLQGMDDVINI